MELRILQYFLTVAQEGNMTKAAELLHLTQPTLSRQIMQLEQELGVTLLDRAHNLQLTSDGIILKQKAQEILNLVDQTKHTLQKKEPLLTGTIRIGLGEFDHTDCLLELLSNFQKIYPYVTYDFYAGDLDELEHRIQADQLDAALVTPAFAAQTYDITPLPYYEQWGLLVQQDSPLAARTSICPQDILGEKIIMPSSPHACAPLYNWLHVHYNRLHVIATSNMPYTAALYVAQQGCVAFCPLTSHLTYKGIRCLPLTPDCHILLFLIWKKTVSPSPTCRELRKYMEHELRLSSLYMKES